jgi:hypothetical protein
MAKGDAAAVTALGVRDAAAATSAAAEKRVIILIFFFCPYWSSLLASSIRGRGGM